MSYIDHVTAGTDPEPEITGLLFSRLVTVMEELSKLVDSVIKSKGISELIPDQWYSRRLHNECLEDIRLRLGDQALFALGFAAATIAYNAFYEQTNTITDQLIDSKSNADTNSQHFLLIDSVLKLIQLAHQTANNNSRNHPSTYGFYAEHLGELRFRMTSSSFPVQAWTPYGQGVLHGILRMGLPDFWQFTMAPDIESPSRAQGDVSDSYEVIFVLTDSTKPVGEMRLQETLRVKQNLLVEAVNAAQAAEEKASRLLNHLMDSVNYARQLQNSQLPRAARLSGRFASFDVLWEPRDIIGGDLWWISSEEFPGAFSLAVTDSTGHGVPGAMLSLLVNNSLERIYSNQPDLVPAQALMNLDALVRSGLNQDSEDGDSDDGCDAIILKIDQQESRLAFAGAKLDLFRIEASGHVHRYRGSRISLGYRQQPSVSDMPITQEIIFNKGDLFLLVTDGFTDQPGGDMQSPRCLGYRRLEQWLAGLAGFRAEAALKSLKSSFSAWQGQQLRRDDVTALAFTL